MRFQEFFERIRVEREAALGGIWGNDRPNGVRAQSTHWLSLLGGGKGHTQQILLNTLNRGGGGTLNPPVGYVPIPPPIKTQPTLTSYSTIEIVTCPSAINCCLRRGRRGLGFRCQDLQTVREIPKTTRYLLFFLPSQGLGVPSILTNIRDSILRWPTLLRWMAAFAANQQKQSGDF